MSTENIRTLAEVNADLAIFARGGEALAIEHARAQVALDVDAGLYPDGVGLMQAKQRADAGYYPAYALGRDHVVAWVREYRAHYAVVLAEARLVALQDAEQAAWEAFLVARQARVDATGESAEPLRRPA